MTIQQMFVAFVCLLLATQQITAVVNNQKSGKSTLDEVQTSANVSDSTKVADSSPAASEPEAKRREAPISDSYGLPLTGSVDTYAPSGPSSNLNLPAPVYGVPNAPSNNIVYPAPPPDIPPPPSVSYGTPFQTYGLPQTVDLETNFNDFVPPPPPPPPPLKQYGLPIKSQKPFFPPVFHSKPLRPRPQYGPPPKPIFIPKVPKPIYGPPKPIYGPPKSPLFVSQKPFKQQSVTVLTAPHETYGPPHPPQSHYGPPEPIPHGPPHPGVPAPPTPPDIKYDGWQPIPGLVSRPPSDSYGVPEGDHHHHQNHHHHHHHHQSLQDNTDLTPPPVGHGHLSTQPLSAGYIPPAKVSDSYGAPLNSVTGSGAIVSTPGDHHDDQSLSLGLSAAGINGQNHLSVVKSIGYELFPNSLASDTYGAPPPSSYSPDGPYAASHSYKSSGISSLSFGGSIKSLQSNGVGLIPPSGFYGVPPSGQYGTPLLSKPNHYVPSLNALRINQPKQPLLFGEPVPTGLLESVGQHTAHNDAHGIIHNSHSFTTGPAYIPPPVPDVTKHHADIPLPPSNLYSLPNPSSSFSFHQGNQVLNSYTAPLGSIDGSYGPPLQSSSAFSIGLDHAHSGGLHVGIDNSLPPVSIDLTSSTSNLGTNYHLPHGYYHGGHDCSKSHGSQPLPSLTYGVPAANTYTASLSSLTTNIGAYAPHHSDLDIEHSSKVSTSVPANAIDSHGKNYGKSLAQNFGPDTELIKSQSIDVNNIPVKGSLGSYTLQIQSADSLGNPVAEPQVSHAQVLNGGLLESILAAIEQPDKKDAKILGRPITQLQVGDSSEIHSVVVPAPVSEATTTQKTTTETSTELPLRLIDDNEIALYFSNKEDDKKVKEDEVRNGQQYGSYVSFKTPDASFGYGDIPDKD